MYGSPWCHLCGPSSSNAWGDGACQVSFVCIFSGKFFVPSLLSCVIVLHCPLSLFLVYVILNPLFLFPLPLFFRGCIFYFISYQCRFCSLMFCGCVLSGMSFVQNFFTFSVLTFTFQINVLQSKRRSEILKSVCILFRHLT